MTSLDTSATATVDVAPASGTGTGTGTEAPADTGTRELLVRQVRLEADGVVSLQLADPSGKALAPWEPGAHLDLVLPSGLVRQYSLCGDPAERHHYTVAVLKEPASRGGSREIHDTGLVGRLLTVRGPRNQFRLTDAEHYLFLAGGIGVTPIVPMLAAVAALGRPYRLVYGGRTRASMAFLDRLGAIGGGTLEVLPEDEAGWPDLDAIVSSAPAGTAVYCCGPAGMIAALEGVCERHLPPGSLHVERFTAPVAPVAGELDAEPGATFEVELARTGVVLQVPPDRSLLRVVLEAVPSHLYSCEEGYCGTCEARVLDGEPDHRDTVLTDEEKDEGKMILCVGRACSPRLVLDL